MKLPERIISLLEDAPVIGHFATAVDNKPHVTPVWLDYDRSRDLILIDTMSDALKLKHVQRNPAVSLSFVSPSNSSMWVVLKGTVTSVKDMGDDVSHVQALACKYLGRPKGCPGHRFMVEIEISRHRWWGEAAGATLVDDGSRQLVI